MSFANEFCEQIRAALLPGEIRQQAQAFLDPGVVLPRFLIGRNDESKAIRDLISIDGLIDDFSQDVTDEKGTPIVKSNAVPGNAWVVNCSTSISPVSVNRMLDAKGLSNRLSIADLVVAANGKLAWPWFVREQRQSVADQPDAWAQLYASLADAESRQTLLNVVCYRLTADARYMQNYTVRLRDQYFEPFMQYSEEVFVDAGGFDGDTTEEFCRRYPDYRRVYLFEPSDTNMQAARRRLEGLRDIEFMTLALSDREETLSFDAEAGSASSVSHSSAVKVSARKMDDVVGPGVSFIKMDLEGWELKALAGATRIIQQNQCKLAISVYHGARDFLDVYRFVLDLNPDYRVYLRHYTQGWSETVMYFLPLGKSI